MGDILLCAASFYGDGFVQLKGTEASSRNTLHVRFRTSSLSGLLFLAAGQNDFLLLEMNAGRLQVSHVANSPSAMFRSTTTKLHVETCQFHLGLKRIWLEKKW